MIVLFPKGDGLAARPAVQSITITRLPLASATDWQQAIAKECRRQRALTPSLPAFLKRVGLLDRCTFLSADGPGAPLIFRHLGVPTLSVLGRAWGRTVINRPDAVDPHEAYAQRIGGEYAETIGAGEAVFNRVTVSGLGTPFTYTHGLFGWEDRGRRAILSAVNVHPLH